MTRLRRTVLGLAAIGLVTSCTVGASSTAEAAAVPGCSTSTATGATATKQFAPTGATANDSSDDRPEIQAAIDKASAAGGGTVTVPAGTFLINAPLFLKSKVRLTGKGSAGTAIKAGPSFLKTVGPINGHPLISTYFANNVTISNLTADQSGDTLNGNVNGRLSEFLVDVRHSTNALVTGVRTKNPFTYSIVAASSTRFCIVANTTGSVTTGRYDQLDGIHVINSNTGDVANNVVDQATGTDGDDGLVAHAYGGTVHDVRYVDNKVRGGSNGHAMQFSFQENSDQIYNIYVARNEFWGSPQGIMTGYYGSTASAHDITISSNYFHDNRRTSVEMSGRLSNVKVSDNRACRSLGFTLPSGNGNQISGTTGC